MRKRLLTFLRVPERPDPPPGAEGEVETFRATRGFFYYSVLMWLPKQAAALTGLYFSLAFVGSLHSWGFEKARSDEARELLEKLVASDIGFAWMRFDLANILLFFEGLAIVTWLTQLLFTGFLLRASWELRWYMVGERALRIRYGLWTVREQTMTIANIQNMVVRQGPLQRLFGFSDLEVSTAGGGGKGSSGEDPTEKKDSFHIGRFRGLEDAAALRDKLRRRLQGVQGTTEAHGAQQAEFGVQPNQNVKPYAAARVPGASAETGTSAGTTAPGSHDLLVAAQELAAEARALRQTVSSR